MHSSSPTACSSFGWPDGEPYEDHPRGTLKSGKEAEIFLVERRYASGARLLAHKRYRPRYPRKGQLRAEGFSNSTSYRGDSIYKAGWFLPTRDKKAVMGGSRYGHELAFRLWPIQEWTMLRRAWEAGASVPYPVEQTEHGLLMEFIGDDSRAAPKQLMPDGCHEGWNVDSDGRDILTVSQDVSRFIRPDNRAFRRPPRHSEAT